MLLPMPQPSGVVPAWSGLDGQVHVSDMHSFLTSQSSPHLNPKVPLPNKINASQAGVNQINN